MQLATARAQERLQLASPQVRTTSQQRLERFLAASRPVQAATVAGPLAVLVAIIVGKARQATRARASQV